jgi:hypothetical protein
MERFAAFLADVFTSKKALAALATLLVILLQALGLPITEEMIQNILLVVGPYMVGQGIADNGKEAARVNAQPHTPPKRF